MLVKSYIIDNLNKQKVNISNKELENILASMTDDSFIKDNTAY